MRVFALSDPHLSLGTPDKEMSLFGAHWHEHDARMAASWDRMVSEDDLVLVPGDISWAKRLDQAAPDLAWLGERPGTKVICKGNHEMWWASKAKVRAALPERCHALEADALRLGPVALCGTRLWEVPGVDYHDWIDWQGDAVSPEPPPDVAARDQKIYRRELGRLERALEAMGELAAGGGGDGGSGGCDAAASVRVALVHYPPVAPGLAGNEVTALFEQHRVDHVVFGHLHALRADRLHEIGGEARGVRYHLASCDAIDFEPRLVCEI